MSFSQFLASMQKEERLRIALPIKVSLDLVGKITQWTCTYEISRHGVRLQGAKGITTVGQKIWVQRKSRRAEYRVIWIGQPGTNQAEQVGAECCEEDKCIWDDEVQIKLK
jgi:hypothetical protein